jgi:LysM repeat protein
MKAFRLLPVLMVPLLTVSCKNTKNTGYEDPYAANFATDGGYNPYPSGGGGGYEAPASTPAPTYEAPSTPNYEAPPTTDNYAFESPSKPAPSPSKPKTSSSSSSTVKKKPTSTTAKKSSSSKTHTVAKGDTLYGLALKNKTTVAKIKAANGMSSDLIRLGQKIKIP